MSGALRAAKGAVAISGYRCRLMDKLYGDWNRVDELPHLCNSSKTERVESVWLNFSPKSSSCIEDESASSPLKKGPAEKAERFLFGSSQELHALSRGDNA